MTELAHNLDTNGALPSDDVWIVIGRDINVAARLHELSSVGYCLFEGIPEQDCLSTTTLNSLYFDAWRCFRHHNNGLHLQRCGRQSQALSVIARRSRYHATIQLLARQLRQLIKRASALKRKDRLHILSFQQNAVAKPLRQQACLINGRLACHVVDASVQDPFYV